jgi:transposase
MAKRQFVLNEERVNELIGAHAQCKDGPTRTRLLAVRLYGTGYPVRQIVEITSCSRTSLLEWCQKYTLNGVEGLTDHRLGGNHAKLKAEQIAEVKQLVHQYTPRGLLGLDTATRDGQFWTVKDLAQLVERRFGVVYDSLNSYYRLFRLCEFTLQRPARQYRSRREGDVAAFEAALEANC